jgi:hypothetical protein
MPFYSNADNLIKKMEGAEKRALLKTDAEVMELAGQTVAVDSGDLQADIDIILPPTQIPTGFTSEVGSQNLDYAAIQEMGPATPRNYTWKPYLRPALDEKGPELAKHLKKEFGKKNG